MGYSFLYIFVDYTSIIYGYLLWPGEIWPVASKMKLYTILSPREYENLCEI